MPAKILTFPTRYRLAAPRTAASSARQRCAWLHGRPHPLDQMETALLRLDWAIRKRTPRPYPLG